MLKSILCSLLVFVSCSLSAEDYIFDQSIRGAVPNTSSPWASVSIYSVDSNTLNIELNPFNLSPDSYMRYWHFNFKDGIDLNQLQFSTVGGNSNTQASVSKGVNSFSVQDGGKYDIRVHFPEAQQQRFFGGESVVLQVSAVNPIDPLMFDFGSYTNNPSQSYYSALEVWGVNGNQKAWIGSNSHIAVPEPSTYIMLAMMLGVVGLTATFGRRKKA